MSSMNETLVHVDTPSRAYDVHVGVGVLSEVGAVTRRTAGGERACVVADSNVWPLYGEKVVESLREAAYDASHLIFPAGERSKNLATLGDLLEGLAGLQLTRDDVVVALGGGVTGDMAGFAAASYLRGCKVVQVPTSLLAMVDSSVGGKVAVDLKAGKNLAGAFFQPHAVIADVACLQTISHTLLTDSCGEVVKHAVLADGALLDELAVRPLNDPSRTPQEVAAIVAQNVRIKRDVVSADERERGLRQTLNLGHTIGHAIEAASDFRLGHGSCVAAGLCCMARACEAKCWTDARTVDRITSAVEAHGLPTDTQVDHESLFHYATHDKKRHGNTMNVVVPRGIQDVEVRRVSLPELRELIDLGCGA